MLSDILEYTEADEAAEYLKEMEPRKAAAILSGMETDSLAEVLRMLDKGKKRLLIDLLDDDVRHDIEVIASFDEDEIGSRMTTNCIIIQKNVTVKEAMSSLCLLYTSTALPVEDVRGCRKEWCGSGCAERLACRRDRLSRWFRC